MSISEAKMINKLKASDHYQVIDLVRFKPKGAFETAFYHWRAEVFVYNQKQDLRGMYQLTEDFWTLRNAVREAVKKAATLVNAGTAGFVAIRMTQEDCPVFVELGCCVPSTWMAHQLSKE